MCTGVCIALAGTLLTASPKMYGIKNEITIEILITMKINKVSFTVK